MKHASMKQEDNRCSICGACLQHKTITYTQTLDERMYIVTGVPADVCPRCGEQYLSPDTADVLQEVIEKQQASEVQQVPIYHFPQTAR